MMLKSEQCSQEKKSDVTIGRYFGMLYVCPMQNIPTKDDLEALLKL